MIKIHYPQDESVIYIMAGILLWGPLQVPGSKAPAIISTRSDLDSLIQGAESWGENDVTHQKIDADIYFNPALSDARYEPSLTYPHRLSALLSGRYTPPSYRVAYGGIVQTRHVATATGQSALISEASGSNFVQWTVGFTESGGKLITADIARSEYTVVGVHPSDRFYFNYKSQNSTHRMTWFPGMGPPITETRLLSSLQNWHQSGTLISQREQTTSAEILTWNGRMNTSVNLFMDRILPSLVPHPDGFISSDIDDFGTMASRAVSKMDRTSSNMLEFISELRRPAKLIPKLKNLKKLKGWSEEYLRTQYGILPTISDLQNIIGMFRGAKPYFDKNGFSTYHAGDSATLSSNGQAHHHSRQIKVATQSEDNGILALINRIDESGFLPDFANLWDLVPFSFVLDWFVDVGSVLERIDMNSRIARLNIPYVTMSEKRQISATIDHSNNLPYTGTIEAVSYQRWTTGRCPTPPLLLESDNARKPQSYWLEGSALIVSLKK